MSSRRNPYPDGPPTPGEHKCGDLVVRTRNGGAGETYWRGPDLADDSGQVQVIRSCMCGGWFRADPADFQLAPAYRAIPAPPNLCRPVAAR